MVLVTLADIFQRFVPKPSKRKYTIQNDEDHVSKQWRTVLLTIITVYLKYTTQNTLSNTAFDNQCSQNLTLHLNKKQVLLHVERYKQVPETVFYLQPKNLAEQSSNIHFWNVLNVVLESFSFAQETKAAFISNRYHKTSQTQDVKSQSTKHNLQ